jgi:hypothetical protein
MLLMRSAEAVLSHRLSRRTLLFLLLGVPGLSLFLLFTPYLHSMEYWTLHKTASFEGDSVSLPKRWISGEKDHLLSIRRPATTLLFPYESTIVIDPFAERWAADKIDKVSDLWLRWHGSPAEGRFTDTRTGKRITFASDMRCVSPSSSSERHYVRIYCLSVDSVHSFEFFGERDAVSDFVAVSKQVSGISRKYPGMIVRR